MTRNCRLIPLSAALLTGLLIAGGLTWAVRAQAAPRDSDMKIWDGVYTAPQADRGKAVYAAYCEKCHGIALAGGRRSAEGGPPLAGATFFQDWERQNLNSLLSKIEGTMPLDSPASLRTNDYVDVAAYILSGNAFPPGNVELARDSKVLEGIPIMRKNAATADAPSFALVRLVGCLTPGPEHTWTLTQGSAPVTTKTDALSPAELSEAAPEPLGSQTFRLLDATRFKPESKAGRKVAAKGLLNRVPDSRIDLVSLEAVAQTCAN